MNYTLLAAGILPALVLIYYIWRRDNYQREPVGQLLKGFFFGVLSTAFAGSIEAFLVALGFVPQNPATWLGAIWDAFAGVAIVEEGVKLFFLWLLLRRNKHYDEMMDGIVYAVCVGMGFAAAENIGYLVANINQWQEVAVGRAIFSIPGHFMFAVAMGYYYSICHFTYASKREKFNVLFIPVLLHGIFDSLLMMANVTPALSGLLWLVFVVFCLCLPRMARRKINKLLEQDRQWKENVWFTIDRQ